MKKILAISSPGGHWIQLGRICQGLEKKHQVIYAMPEGLFKADTNKKVYSISDASATSKLKLIPCAFKVLYILLKEKPDSVISTGAAPGLVAIMLARLLKIQTIWVDSIANVKQISRSGRLIQSRVDVFLTQWQHLADNKTKTTIQYQGSVL